VLDKQIVRHHKRGHLVLEGSKYTVRRLQHADAPSFYEAVRESIGELAYWMPWCSKNYSLSDAETWIQTTSDMWDAGVEYPLGVFDAATGAVVGGTGVNQINRTYRIGNIGYWVSSKRTGEGIARFAAHQSAVLGFRELGLTRLEIVVLTHNEASQRVARAVGAKLECEARNRLYFHGTPHNAFVYSLVPDDLR
jgi:ribosomal-protein-serine acetyltransferase